MYGVTVWYPSGIGLTDMTRSGVKGFDDRPYSDRPDTSVHFIRTRVNVVRRIFTGHAASDGWYSRVNPRDSSFSTRSRYACSVCIPTLRTLTRVTLLSQSVWNTCARMAVFGTSSVSFR